MARFTSAPLLHSSTATRQRVLRSGVRLAGRYLLLRRVQAHEPSAWVAEDEQVGDPVDVVILSAHSWPPERARQVVSALQRQPDLSPLGVRDRLLLADGRTAVVTPHATHSNRLDDALGTRPLTGRRLERQVLQLARQLEFGHRAGLALGSDAFAAIRWCRIQGQGWRLVIPLFWGHRDRPRQDPCTPPSLARDVAALGLVFRHLELSSNGCGQPAFLHARGAWHRLIEEMISHPPETRAITLTLARLCLTEAPASFSDHSAPLRTSHPAPRSGPRADNPPPVLHDAHPVEEPGLMRTLGWSTLLLALAVLFTYVLFQTRQVDLPSTAVPPSASDPVPHPLVEPARLDTATQEFPVIERVDRR